MKKIFFLIDEMVHAVSPSLFQENSHPPGQDTLEEMIDKQKFFSVSNFYDFSFSCASNNLNELQ